MKLTATSSQGDEAEKDRQAVSLKSDPGYRDVGDPTAG